MTFLIANLLYFIYLPLFSRLYLLLEEYNVRVSMGLSVSRNMALNLTVSRNMRQKLTVSRNIKFKELTVITSKLLKSHSKCWKTHLWAIKISKFPGDACPRTPRKIRAFGALVK